MIIKRPSIYIYTHQADSNVLREICAGIEEEGVFFEQMEQEESDMNTLVWQAAQDSMPGSGIGICGTTAALQIRGMQKGRFVESYQKPTKEQCRKLGSNSARAIKRQAFK